ncbi:STAS domain-containing protein [uncultured Chloroflexus sp.]|uniref:STAS domain-containing protein n=1 Tax=uncultured Chloroflexus sp. TaxID=214040 RepID=UPI00261493C7|nr:STAS domain-containing protein [uncultured Chloroflexus sp.]
MRVDQRSLALVLMGGMAGYTLVRGLLNIVFGDPLTTIILTLIVSAIFWIATWLYWRGWEGARMFATSGVALVVAFGLPLEGQTIVLFTPLAFAIAITNTQWVAGIGLAMIAILLGRDVLADGRFDSVYADVGVLASYIVQVVAFAAARLALDTARIEAERNAAQAEAARAEIAERAAAIEQQRHELAEQNQRQQELLELVSQLETPAVRIADGVLLVPLVGGIDSQRAGKITRRLLELVYERRVNLVILDVAGVPLIDTAVANALTQTVRSLRLLGCRVTLTGISSQVALTLTHIGIELHELEVAASPQEALQRWLSEQNTLARNQRYGLN